MAGHTAHSDAAFTLARHSVTRRSRVAGWIVAAFGVLIVAIFVASYFLDPFIRTRVENTMNEKLVGYHTSLAHAHLQLLNGSLILSGLLVKQNKHPTPPVADLPEMAFHIQWSELLIGRIVADVVLDSPHVHINLTQLRSESADPVPLSKEGWQDAIQSVYPFKINRFRVRDGEAIYIDTDPSRPLYLKDISLRADNIRNIRSRHQLYPSPFQANAVVFENGRLTIHGKGNFLDKPFPGILANYSVERIPLSKFENVIERENIHVYQGTLQSKGVVEYSPKIARADVANATIDGVHLDYVHTSQSAAGETRRLDAVKTEAAKVNNAAGIELTAHEIVLTHSELKFLNEAATPHYRLTISDTNLRATNLSNHQSEGTANLQLSGKFMGSGDTTFNGVLRPENQGPDFDFDLASQNTDLTSLNDLLRAFGKFDVASGRVSVYSQVTVKDHYVNGYIKPLFSDITVYDSRKDAKKPILHQVYELAIGGAAKLLKNHSTQRVATKVDISGPFNTPNMSAWQAIGQFLENAFINAIVPGYDREVAQARHTPS